LLSIGIRNTMALIMVNLYKYFFQIYFRIFTDKYGYNELDDKQPAN